MSSGSELKSAGAKALRAAGFVPLPRRWVKSRDLDQIRIFAEQYSDEINAIRGRANKAKVGDNRPAFVKRAPIPLTFKPVGTHLWTATGAGWLYTISLSGGVYRAARGGVEVHEGPCLAPAEIACQTHCRAAVLALSR